MQWLTNLFDRLRVEWTALMVQLSLDGAGIDPSDAPLHRVIGGGKVRYSYYFHRRHKLLIVESIDPLDGKWRRVGERWGAWWPAVKADADSLYAAA